MKAHFVNPVLPLKIPWPTVRLEEVLTPTERGETVDAAKEYRLLGVRLDGQGPFLRETVTGTQTSANKLFRVTKGDFIYSRLFACRGAFGVISKELDGCFVSGEFPTFIPVPGEVDVEYLKYWFRLPSVIARVDADCSGSTPLTRNRFKENFFLALEIPLPPLAEQRRVVARIEELAAQIHEARTLRHQAAEEAEVVMGSASADCIRGCFESHELRPVGDTFTFRNDLVRPTDGASGSLRFVGLQHVESNTGRKIGEDHLMAEELAGRKFRFSPGEIVYGYLRPYLNKVWIANCEGVCSVDQYVLKPRAKVSDTDYLAYYLRSGLFLEQAIELTHNLMLPRLRSALLQGIQIPLPPLPEQRRIVAELDALQAEVNALKRLQAETAAELDALLPAILDRAFKGEL